MGLQLPASVPRAGKDGYIDNGDLLLLWNATPNESHSDSRVLPEEPIGLVDASCICGNLRFPGKISNTQFGAWT